jgi:two-component system, repressor protein LuxO
MPSSETDAWMELDPEPFIEVVTVDDDPDIVRLVELILRGDGYRFTSCHSGAALDAVLADRVPDAVLLDLRLPDEDGLSVLRRVKAAHRELPMIILTAHATVPDAVEAMKHGAYDFIMKPIDKARLRITVKNATEMFRLRRKLHELEERNEKRVKFEGLIGVSAPMQAIYTVIENVSPTDVTILVTGESGTGKELIARAIHTRSRRKDGPFVALNCAAIPRDLLESELFGHEAGAFTGAKGRRIGCCEEANAGTLFLDEIGEMDINLQAKMLRFLQERSIRRVGDNKTIRVDVRIVAATNRDPLEEIREGRFREDLYYRLNVVPIVVPPLRERAEDVPVLAMHFLQKFSAQSGKAFSGFTSTAMRQLMLYGWPGNVRELENTTERMVVLNPPPEIDETMLPANVKLADGGALDVDVQDVDATNENVLPFVEVEKRAIENALRACNGNVAQAARRLGLGQATLYRKIKKFQLTRDSEPH